MAFTFFNLTARLSECIQVVDATREHGVILFVELCYWSMLVVEKLKSSLEICRRIGVMMHLKFITLCLLQTELEQIAQAEAAVDGRMCKEEKQPTYDIFQLFLVY